MQLVSNFIGAIPVTPKNSPDDKPNNNSIKNSFII